MTGEQEAYHGVERRLRRPVALTWTGLLAERLARAFWAPVTLLMAVAGVLLLGAARMLPDPWILGVAGAVAVLVLGLGLRGVRGFVWPRREAARARLDAGLPGRPLATLRDRPAVGGDDPDGAQLWQAHLARMAAAAAGARAPRPDPGLTRRDPLALRYLALLLLGLGGLFGSADNLALALRAGGGPDMAVAAGPAWEGWIRSPAHTGRPVVYLNDLLAPAVEVPADSRVVLRLYDRTSRLQVTQTVADEAPPATDATQEFTVTRHGRLEVTGPGGRGWDIAALPDLPPTIRLTGTMERAVDGGWRLPFTANDDYGVASGQARITLDLSQADRRHGLAAAPEDRPPVTLDLPLPFQRDRRDIIATLQDDLSRHPFANLPVTVELTVTDAAGQTGHSTPLATILPGRRFFDPLAAAVAELRRDLLWSRANAPQVAGLLRAITHRPEDIFRSPRAYLRLRAVLRAIDAGLDAPTRDTVAEELWDIALILEDGDLSSALERLQRAQDRLESAMRDGVSPAEIAELMAEYRAALDDYLQQLAQEGSRHPDEQLSGLDTMQMTGDELQELLNRLQQLMEEGRMAEAQELMDLLRELLQNLRVAQGEAQPGSGGAQGQMRDLGDMLRDQQGLADDTFRDLQEGFSRQLGQGEPGNEPGDSASPSDDDRSLADRQRDLRNRLQALGRAGIPGDDGAAAERGRQALDEAGRAMEGAEQALREGDTGAALDRQSAALEALREGMRAVDEATAADPSGGAGMGSAGQARDPLGRQAGTTGTDTPMQSGGEAGHRAQELLQELRRRAGERDRPAVERDYLHRLLDPF